MKRIFSILAVALLAPTLHAASGAANQILIEQVNAAGTRNEQRKVTPIAGQVLGFNAQLEPVMLELTGGGSGSYTFTASDFNESGSTVSIDYLNGQAASAATKGFLTAADWSLFNAKLGTSAIGSTVQAHSAILDGTTASFTTALETKLAGIQTGAQANAALASQAEAEAGTDNTKTMTPLRVAQAISVLGGGGTGVTDGDKGDIIVSGGGTVFTLDALDELDVGTLNVTSLGSTIIPGANGGTGIANTGKTITLGGNVTMSGAYTFTGTLTGNTSVTYPTSGTLASTTYVDDAVAAGGGGVPAGVGDLWPTANIASPPTGYFAAGEYGTTANTALGDWSIIVKSAGTVADPTPSTPSGEVAAGTVITLSSATSGAFFTTTNNTTDPTYIVGAVGNTFTVNEAGTWEVRANKQGYVSSAVQSFTYTISGGGGGPTLVASDDFDTYANGAALGSQSGWAGINGTIEINKPAADGSFFGGDNSHVRRTDTFNANQRSEVTLEVIGTSFAFVGVSVRCQSGANTRYQLQVDGSLYYLSVVSAGTFSHLSGHAGTSLSLSAGDRVAIEASGTGSATRLKIQKYTSGAWSDVATNIDPSTYIDGGTPGVGGDGGGPATARGDEWRGYNL